MGKAINAKVVMCDPTCASRKHSAFRTRTSDSHGGSGAVHSHSRCRKVPPAHAHQSAAGPHAEDRTHGEVGVDDR